MLPDLPHSSSTYHSGRDPAELVTVLQDAKRAIQEGDTAHVFERTRTALEKIPSLPQAPSDIIAGIHLQQARAFEMTNRSDLALRAIESGLTHVKKPAAPEEILIRAELLSERSGLVTFSADRKDTLSALREAIRLLQGLIVKSGTLTSLSTAASAALAATYLRAGHLYGLRFEKDIRRNARIIKSAVDCYERASHMYLRTIGKGSKQSQEADTACGDMLMAKNLPKFGLQMYLRAFETAKERGSNNLPVPKTEMAEKEALVGLLIKITEAMFLVKDVAGAHEKLLAMRKEYRLIDKPAEKIASLFWDFEAKIAEGAGSNSGALVCRAQSLKANLTTRNNRPQVVRAIVEAANFARRVKAPKNDLLSVLVTVAESPSIKPLQKIIALRQATKAVERSRAYRYATYIRHFAYKTATRKNVSESYVAAVLCTELAKSCIRLGKLPRAEAYLKEALLKCPAKKYYLSVKLRVYDLRRSIEEMRDVPYKEKVGTLNRIEHLRSTVNPSNALRSAVLRAKLYVEMEYGNMGAIEQLKTELLDANNMLDTSKRRDEAAHVLNIGALGSLNALRRQHAPAEEQFGYLLHGSPELAHNPTEEYLDLLTQAGHFFSNRFILTDEKPTRLVAIACYEAAEKAFKALHLPADAKQLGRLRDLRNFINPVKTPRRAEKLAQKIARVEARLRHRRPGQ